MKTKLKKILLIASMLLGSLLLIGAVFSLIDPQGAQLADDGDPFGTPPSVAHNLRLLLISLVLILFPASRYFKK